MSFADHFSKKERLKRRAKRLYKYMQHKMDTVDCGASLLRTISASYAKTEDDFIRTMRELAKIDPDAKAVCERTPWIGLGDAA